MPTAARTSGANLTLTESINVAWSSVKESGVPDHMQGRAFTEALRSTLNSVQHATATGHGLGTPSVSREEPDGRKAESGGEQEAPIPEEVVFRRVSDETGIPVDKLLLVFHIDDGAVKLIGQHTKYGSTTAEQARAVAQIVTVVRKVGMGHSDTAFEVIKVACESKHCYDSKNFASQHLPKIDGFVVKGESKARRLEARGSGIAALPDLIDRVLGVL
ncbi:hypothetical protein E3O44_02260 [Cryobacterium algoricola]|uniref:Uncharacterized protein n=1 Tax=Cryobacterium algoricola TaxID=1259183 RepID=A0ABY2IJ03_9MICO|nr:hypothetical protein [Cryobacterium algoricola]TFB90458.1 hypothetical protein E3O44_02260 [Cryobacterium algoricola]